jgi:hypothetical protein
MIKTLSILLIALAITIHAYGQDALISPENNPANKSYLKDETSEMKWFMVNDSVKVEIGKVYTKIRKTIEKIYLVTSVDMKQASAKWIDSTIVTQKSFEPMYHSSYNQQRDMVLNFGDKVTGYYFDKKTNSKTEINVDAEKPFFDSNFYPQIIRWLPLEEGYSTSISIFDYNPAAKIGVIKAVIRSTEKSSIEIHGEKRSVWKVQVTDKISGNSVISIFYIDRKTRELLKQEIDAGNRKMLLEIME